MRRLSTTALVAAVCLLLVAFAHVSSSAQSRTLRRPQQERPTAELLSESRGRTVMRLTVDADRSEASTLVRVPDAGAVEIEVTGLEFVGPDGEFAGRYDRDAGDLVVASEPAVMRDVRVIRVTFAPGELELPRGATALAATVVVTTTGGPGTNEKLRHHRLLSPAFSRVYDSMLLNYGPDDRDVLALEAGGAASPPDAGRGGERELVGSRYLIITVDSFAGEVDSLVAWKTAKGLLPVVVTPPSGVWSRYELKDYIDTAYNTWDVPPEFVLFLGDTELVPTGGGEPKTDNYFAHVEGDDYLLDILVGRLPASDTGECRTMLAKTLSYDRPWIHGDENWPLSASLLVREDGDASDDVYYANTWFAYDLMEAAGYSPIDTLFAGPYVTPGQVIESLSAGKGFVNYRGVSGDYWAAPFSIWPGNIDCGWKLPIVMSATCLSGNYYDDSAICEAFLRAGDEVEPRGGVAFFGTSTWGAGLDLSVKRGYVDDGFFAGAFGPDRTLGEACTAAKTNLFVHLDDRDEYEGWNLLGDPELSVWTAPTSDLAVEHNGILSMSAELFTASVTADGQPVEGAEVVLECMPGTFAGGVTDATGLAELSLAVSEPCTLRLTVVAKNARPYESSVRVLPNGPFVAVDTRYITDASGGNGDGFASPGESVSLSLALVNLGDQSAPAVEARLTCDDDQATVLDSLTLFGSIAPDSIAWGASDFVVAVDADWTGGYDLPLTLTLSYGESTAILPLPPLETVSGDMAVFAVHGDDASPGGDGDGSLEPGEVVAVDVLLDCAARSGLTGVTGVLSSRSSRISVTAADAAFPDVDSGSQCANGSAPFIVSVAPDAAPGDAKLFLRVAGDASTYAYAETLDLELSVAEVAPLYPTGPDGYGYYAYDSSDTLYAEAPAYEWTEIAQPGLRLNDVSDSDNGIEELQAPFNMRYYGLVYQELWVSSNGVVSVYPPNGNWVINSEIPSLIGPPGMFAPFWDDLDPSAGGDIYAWFDASEHRYIVEYDNVRHADSEATETFQIVIYDPDHHPTPTGDCAIEFLYEDVEQPGSCTVGIEHPYQTVGIEFLFDGEYGAYAAPLADGLAIRFTSTSPETLAFPWLVLGEVLIDDSEGGDGDGIPDPGETLSLVVELRNDGPVTATGIDLALSGSTSGVSVTDGSALLADINPGLAAGNESDPFVVEIDPSTQDSLATLWVHLGAESNTRQGAVRFDMRLGSKTEPVSAKLQLYACHPNPFVDGTSVSFNMPETGRAVVRIYDVAGRLVATADDSVRGAGPQRVGWNGSNDDGESVASGVYFVLLEAAGDSRTRKVVLLR